MRGRVAYGVPRAVQARLGSLQILKGSNAVPGERSEPVRLLTVDAPEMWGPDTMPPAEAWAVALQTTVTKGFLGGIRQIVPVRARISAASGGVQTTFEVDASPSCIIPVFAPSVTVEVFWDMPPQNELGGHWSLPVEVEVRGTIHRANLSGQGTLSQLVPRWGNNRDHVFDVPSFVDRFAMRGRDDDEQFKNNCQITVWSGDSTAGIALLSMTGSEMLDVVQDGRWVALPGQARSIQISPSMAPAQPWSLEFGMKF